MLILLLLLLHGGFDSVGHLMCILGTTCHAMPFVMILLATDKCGIKLINFAIKS